MADEQNTGGNTAANKEIKTTGDVFEAAREYKQTKDALEALEKQEAQPVFVESMPQDAQEQRENNEKQRIFDDNGIEIDPETGHYIIRIDTRIDPELQAKLDPNSPQFDAQLYREHTAAAMQRLRDSLEKMRNSLLATFAEVIDTDTIKDTMQGLVSGIATTLQQLYNSDTYKNITKSLQYMAEHAEEMRQSLEEWEQLEPFLEAELQKPEYNGLTLNELLAAEDTDENGEPVENSLIDKAIAAAKAAQIAAQLPAVAAKSVQQYPVTLDKFNTVVVWDFLRELDPTGQLTMLPIKMESNKSKEALTAYYSLYFSEDLPPEIAKKLTPFDRLVYGAAAAVQKINGDIMSETQIHRAMGNTKPPSKRQIQKIHDSLIKMEAAHITLDCTEERKAYKDNKYIDYYGSLFPMEMQRAYINGQLVESAIHILRPELPLISVAKGRNHQIEEIPTIYLDSKLSQTDANIAMQFYTLEQICRIKNGKRATKNKILYATIYKKMGANTAKQQQRALKAFITYLDELKAKGFIKGYEEERTESTGDIGVKFSF